MFQRAEAVRPGSFTVLSDKAQQLMGGRTSRLPRGANSIATALRDEQGVDIFLLYRASARWVLDAAPSLQLVELPPELRVQASFGLAVLDTATEGTERLALFILSTAGQGNLATHGFDAPLLPT